MAYEDDPAEYERRVLDRIRERYADDAARDQMRRWAGRIYLDAKLADSYPYTKLVIMFRNEGDEQAYSVEYPLWSDVFLYESRELSPSGDPRFAPEHVAGDIAIWLEEPGDPRPGGG